MECGPGVPSVDRALGFEKCGSRWALASLAIGAVGSALAISAGRQAVEEQPAEEPVQRTGRFSRDGRVPDLESVRAAASIARYSAGA